MTDENKSAQTQFAPLAVGAPAPDFQLLGEGGVTQSLASYAGKNVVLYFYPKDDTSGCTAEAIAFNGLRADFAKANTHIVGISPDSLTSHTKFKAKHDLTLDLLSDADKTMLSAYGVWVEKSMYGKKYMGVERTTVLIDATGKIVQVWHKVKVPGHAEAVLKAAQAL